MERESMEFDVVIVGAGPAGLSAACKLMQLAQETEQELMVCVIEKGSEVGAHILSGAVLEPTAINELFPDWKEKGAPINVKVDGDDVYYLTSEGKGIKTPGFLVPKPMHNEGNYIVSMGNVCRWLAEQAEDMGVEIFPGFTASEILYNDDGSVKGILTGDMGVAEDGSEKDGYMPGMELLAKQTIFAEGCRGHLGKQLMDSFDLNKDADPQHYGLGIKEIWTIDPEKHQEGLVVHTAGWPLDNHTEGGGFLYHMENNQVSLGFIVALNYTNPHLSPFDEMQRWKSNPKISQFLEDGERVGYGARAVNKGGMQSVPKLSFPGGLLVGCDAGFLNGAKIKGNHTAMKTGMLAAETIIESLKAGEIASKELSLMDEKYKSSWVFEELHTTRNFGPALHKFGTLLGGSFAWLDQNIFAGKLPFTWHNTTPDYDTLKPAAECEVINYPKPDGKLTFDKLSSVFLSSTNHEEDQPCHLKLADSNIPIAQNLPLYDEPAQRYCPAGVYEVVKDDSGNDKFQINGQNCVHCKTCDIKDPAQNITWVTPEGGGGPNYGNM
ncbi:MAG TPA: electron transfer flavoprotein-ubiquinone oxidoreductase [Cycloclasticus sp.]|jgi:electron-transferring-flavoprotein dehydrogenase|nr:electron transfer flavoprotein-ubiquinone oxidoreductase [Cycloclasticus sp.]HIL91215.1 electron transfer flavoprotein-ubiquinone oxidoreductase [Cycloclasticus sp.]